VSFNIQIVGHKGFGTVKEAREFERELVGAVEKFVGGLQGVTAAFVSGDHIGHRQVVEPQLADVPAPEEPEEEQVEEAPVRPTSMKEADQQARRAAKEEDARRSAENGKEASS
jgi:hypothetical protein